MKGRKGAAARRGPGVAQRSGPPSSRRRRRSSAVERVAFATKAADAERSAAGRSRSRRRPTSLVPLNGAGQAPGRGDELPAGARADHHRCLRRHRPRRPRRASSSASRSTSRTSSRKRPRQVTDVGMPGRRHRAARVRGLRTTPRPRLPASSASTRARGRAPSPRRTPRSSTSAKNGEGAFEAYVYPIGRKQGFRVEWQANARRRHPLLRRVGVHPARSERGAGLTARGYR